MNWNFKQTVSGEALWEELGLMEVLILYVVVRTLQEELYVYNKAL